MRRHLALIGVLSILIALAAPAAGEEALLVRIREAALDPGGGVRLVVSVTGEAAGDVLSAANFAVTEEGEPVAELKVEPLLEKEAQPLAVALVMDVSGSTRGQPHEDAKAAARSFVEVLPEGVRMALVAFGNTAELRTGFTSDKQALIQGIDALQVGGETALYDAVALGAVLLAQEQALRNMVVFSDGKDTKSQASIEGAIAAAQDAKAPVTTVGLVTPDFDPPALERLGAETGGRTLEIGQSQELRAAFTQVAKEIASIYVLTYTAARTEPKDLDLSVNVQVGGIQAVDAITVINPRIPPPTPAPTPAPIGPLASGAGLYLGLAAVFLAVALFLVALIGRGSGYAPAGLARRLRHYTRGAPPPPESGLYTSAIGRRMVELMEHAPKPKGYEDRLQVLLDRAGWPMRSSEFLVLRVLIAFVAGIAGWSLSGRFELGLLLAAVGVIVPRSVLKQRIESRSSAFLAQLPDTLQLLAGSLQAGYGLLQAIDTVTLESSPPTSTEFSRVLTEARLGMVLEDAMDSMAERIGNEDFRWVVLAINIQRRVGGNLAHILETVANTLRERDQVRRQISVLSAEGRLSAWILGVLPFALATYLAIVNPEYLGELLTNSFGRAMVVGAVVFLAAGIFWMRKIIRIEV